MGVKTGTREGQRVPVSSKIPVMLLIQSIFVGYDYKPMVLNIYFKHILIV
jgi:hypothetical protein